MHQRAGISPRWTFFGMGRTVQFKWDTLEMNKLASLEHLPDLWKMMLFYNVSACLLLNDDMDL